MAPPRPIPAPARGGVAKKAPLPSAAVTRTFFTQPDTKEVCPLCVEDLDETDKDFFPCPCGYQVCLFCYEKVKEKCNALCPGCRREYGAPVEAPQMKQLTEERVLGDAGRSASGVLVQPRVPPGPIHGVGSAFGLQPASSAPLPPLQPGRTVVVTKPPDMQAQQRRAQDSQMAAGTAMHRTRAADSAAAPALPTGATWAAAGAQATPRPAGDPADQRAQPTPAAVDSSAWPSLAAAAAPPPPVPQQQPQQQRPQQRQDHGSQSADTASSVDSQHHRSASGSSASADGMQSRSSSSQDLTQDVQGQNHNHHHQLSSTASSSASHLVPPHLMDAFATAQVSSTVHGVRHNINVPLPVNGAPVHAYSEASALKSSLQDAVKTGNVSTKDAAARLVALLRQKELEQPGSVAAARSQLAAGRAPPGFGPAALQGQPMTLPPGLRHLQGAPMVPLLNQQDPSIIRPPLGKYQPIQPPIQSPMQVFGGASAAPGSRFVPLQPPQSQSQHHQQPPPQQQQQGFLGLPLVSTSSSGQQPQLQVGGGGGGGLGSATSNGTYSLWSGLPGLELGVAPSPSGRQGTLGLQAGSGLLGQGNGTFPAAPSAATFAPPPGFGPTPYNGRAATASGSLGDSSLLQAQLAGLARPPPPGMSAYRPQLA